MGYSYTGAPLSSGQPQLQCLICALKLFDLLQSRIIKAKTTIDIPATAETVPIPALRPVKDEKISEVARFWESRLQFVAFLDRIYRPSTCKADVDTAYSTYRSKSRHLGTRYRYAIPIAVMCTGIRHRSITYTIEPAAHTIETAAAAVTSINIANM